MTANAIKLHEWTNYPRLILALTGKARLGLSVVYVDNSRVVGTIQEQPRRRQAQHSGREPGRMTLARSHGSLCIPLPPRLLLVADRFNYCNNTRLSLLAINTAVRNPFKPSLPNCGNYTDRIRYKADLKMLIPCQELIQGGKLYRNYSLIALHGGAGAGKRITICRFGEELLSIPNAMYFIYKVALLNSSAIYSQIMFLIIDSALADAFSKAYRLEKYSIATFMIKDDFNITSKGRRLGTAVERLTTQTMIPCTVSGRKARPGLHNVTSVSPVSPLSFFVELVQVQRKATTVVFSYIWLQSHDIGKIRLNLYKDGGGGTKQGQGPEQEEERRTDITPDCEVNEPRRSTLTRAPPRTCAQTHECRVLRALCYLVFICSRRHYKFFGGLQWSRFQLSVWIQLDGRNYSEVGNTPTAH
ncbi:hypothetical protein J6590_000219 [Homalodisca vitripennis]|nr:hypothetical protein J6590_000219 [Homalodisca vitripennis]